MNVKLHDDERAMLVEVGRRHRLWEADAQPELIARGTENTTFAVGGCIVRRSSDARALAREVALLGALAPSTTVPVPDPLMYDPDLGIFAYRRLDGTPLILRNDRVSALVERALVDLLGALRSLEPALLLPVDSYPDEAWHRDAVRAFQRIRSRLTGEQARRVAEFLSEPLPPVREGVSAQHNDLGAEHILVDDLGQVTGVIDWSDAARTDPSRDLGSMFRDLGPDAAFRVAEALGQAITPVEAERIRFHARCRWIEDAEFALEAPASRQAYLDNVRRTFEHTFRDPLRVAR